MQGVFEFCSDLPVRPKRADRLFFGLFPDASSALHVRRFAEQFVRENHLKGTLLRAERLHISLQHVGDYQRLRTRFIYAAREAGKAVLMQPFDVTLHSIKSFEGTPFTDRGPRRWPLVLFAKGDGLFELHKALGRAMGRSGLKAAEGFVPHMTLLYGEKPMPLQRIEPIRFVSREFSLVHSELRLTRYNLIHRWPLEG